VKIGPFDPARHRRVGFGCGDASLDEYLQRYAGQGMRNGLVQVYVAEGDDGRVLGYYTLSASSVRHEEWSEGARRGLPRYPVPAVLIGRMASDARAREAGLRVGSRLLVHALKQSLRAAKILGVRCVIVDSKPGALGFFERFGFLPLQAGGLRLYMPMAAIERLADDDRSSMD
jgi:predicted N-acetyltransferase YhbS